MQLSLRLCLSVNTSTQCHTLMTVCTTVDADSNLVLCGIWHATFSTSLSKYKHKVPHTVCATVQTYSNLVLVVQFLSASLTSLWIKFLSKPATFFCKNKVQMNHAENKLEIISLTYSY